VVGTTINRVFCRDCVKCRKIRSYQAAKAASTVRISLRESSGPQHEQMGEPLRSEIKSDGAEMFWCESVFCNLMPIPDYETARHGTRNTVYIIRTKA